jgi:hypothetical protein
LVDGKLSRAGEEVVIIIKVLADDVNNGYEDLINSRIVEVNGKKILNLKDLIRTVETESAVPYVVFRTEDNETIALDRKKAEEAQDAILATYQISDARSQDLKQIVGNIKASGKEVAKSNGADSLSQ